MAGALSQEPTTDGRLVHSKTPIFYHGKQQVAYAFISVQKIPEFVRQSARLPTAFEPYQESDFWLAHSRNFVSDVLLCKTNNGFGTKDAQINQALHYSNASLWAAAQHVLTHGGVACSASQGFHHAHFDHCYGYCTFNGLVIAAKKALASVDKVLLIDGDAHEGDGTENCLQALNLTRRIINVTRDEIGAHAQRKFAAEDWEAFANTLLKKHQPGLVLYQAGADAWAKDPLGAGYLSLKGLEARDRGIFAATKKAGVPIAWNLAGGYANPMQKTIDIHLQTLRVSDEVWF